MPDSSWTETGSSISLIPTTTPIDPGSSPSNVNYLTNSYKAALMQQYAGELAMKTSLDSLATTWGCSATAYNNAVAAINTTITGFSGAPANWATIWPDGTMSGPWLGVQTLLSSNWSAIATQRTALQAAIGAAQAAAAQATAISTAATNAAGIYATTINAPAVVSSLPTLPNASYPVGKMVVNSADGKLYTNKAGVWTALTVAAGDISGTLAAAQIASVAASQVTGQLSDSQLAAISAAKLTGQITGTQITNGAISTPQLAAGAVTAATIAANTITASQIAAGTVTATQIAAGTVTAANIAAGTIQASNIAAATITGDKIAANAITTTQIAANTITAGDIAANTITAGQIAAGAIGATQIAAGAITTAALTVCDWTNLCYNPGFESGSAQWSLSFASISTAYSHTGTQSLMTPSGVGSLYEVENGNMFPCGAGETYFLQAWVKATSVLTSGSVALRLICFNAAGAVLTNLSVALTPTTSWAVYSASVVTPANTCFAAPALAITPTLSANVYWDDVYVRRCDDANLIVDGAITASKIAAGAITGDMITAGSLTANVIYFTDGFCLNTLEPKESGANVTSGHILTATSKPTSTVTVTGIPTVIVGGFAFSVNAASTSDVYNIFGRIAGRQTAGSTGADCYIALYVDGVNKTYQDCYFAGGLNTDGMCAFYMSITGLTAGAHTFQFYAYSGISTTNWTIWDTSTALCQRIF